MSIILIKTDAITQYTEDDGSFIHDINESMEELDIDVIKKKNLEDLCESIEGYMNSYLCCDIFYEGFDINNLDSFVKKKQESNLCKNLEGCFADCDIPHYALYRLNEFYILFIYHC